MFPQTAPTQNQAESDLLPDLSGSAQNPVVEHVVTPPSTVDTAALSEEPAPGEPLVQNRFRLDRTGPDSFL